MPSDSEMDVTYFLGIDTSNYTTSCSAVSESGEIVFNSKLPLPVREGERGLRQSDAVFHHVKNLPQSAEEMKSFIGGERIAAVGCSFYPRDNEGSYMPCFLAGVSAASMTSCALGVPLYRFSHQAGHVMAAYASAFGKSEYTGERFVAFHVSGGTTEVLLTELDDEKILKITKLGGTRDINAGQAIDRTGVLMGLSFPCGAEMDRAALTFDGRLPSAKISVHGTECDLSGLENKAAALYEKSGSVSETSAFVLDFVARTLEQLTKNVLAEVGELPVVYAGGVMSSEYVKKTLSRYGVFAKPEFSSDNAAGTALLTREKHIRMSGGKIQ